MYNTFVSIQMYYCIYLCIWLCFSYKHCMRLNVKLCELHWTFNKINIIIDMTATPSLQDQYILKMHLKMVHMPAEVLFECTVCSKKFTRKAHLKRHLRIHDPEKPFKCPHCDYR